MNDELFSPKKINDNVKNSVSHFFSMLDMNDINLDIDVLVNDIKKKNLMILIHLIKILYPFF